MGLVESCRMVFINAYAAATVVLTSGHDPLFSPRDVVSHTWAPLLIPPPSRLTALICPFLEPNFPRRWSDSEVGVDARPSQPGRSLPNPTPGPLPLADALIPE
jgi:hypothetical protein